MIVGIGVDMVELARVERGLARFGERFAGRILSSRERAAVHGSAGVYLASRLASKEAAFKALGTGWARGVTWKDVEVLNRASGAPELCLRGGALARLREIGGQKTHISLTHTREHAVALVVIERQDASA